MFSRLATFVMESAIVVTLTSLPWVQQSYMNRRQADDYFFPRSFDRAVTAEEVNCLYDNQMKYESQLDSYKSSEGGGFKQFPTLPLGHHEKAYNLLRCIYSELRSQEPDLECLLAFNLVAFNGFQHEKNFYKMEEALLTGVKLLQIAKERNICFSENKLGGVIGLSPKDAKDYFDPVEYKLALGHIANSFPWSYELETDPCSLAIREKVANYINSLRPKAMVKNNPVKADHISCKQISSGDSEIRATVFVARFEEDKGMDPKAFVLFKGSDGVYDFLNYNLLFWPQCKKSIPIHYGFLRCHNQIWLELKKSLFPPDMHNLEIVFIGHSLGGALAELATFHLVQDEDIFKKTKRIEVFTLNSPRVFYSKKATKFFEALKPQVQMNNFVHPNDIIFRLPPWGVYHSRIWTLTPGKEIGLFRSHSADGMEKKDGKEKQIFFSP